MTGAQAVERGNLDIEVAGDSRDEIGDLSRSFNMMVKELRSKEQIKATFGKYLDPRIVEDNSSNGFGRCCRI
jgi:nitrogen fixation/metabolism regulation signal transduction histidine kinase